MPETNDIKGSTNCQKTSYDDLSINPNDFVKVTRLNNHIINILHSEKSNFSPTIRKINKDEYVVLATGEIFEFEHSDNRSNNFNSLRKTLSKLGELITHNFDSEPNHLFLTLTFKREMTDHKDLYKTFDKFIKRLKYDYRHRSTLDYLSVVEPHGSGEWHIHTIVRFNDLKEIYIPNHKLRRIWGEGFVTIKSMRGIDNIGNYFKAYLSDIELSEDTAGIALKNDLKVVTKEIEGREKKFIKGGRLHFYPPGMNLYRRSRGISDPVVEYMRLKDIKKEVGSLTPNFFKQYPVETEDYQNTFTRIEFNLKKS